MSGSTTHLTHMSQHQFSQVRKNTEHRLNLAIVKDQSFKKQADGPWGLRKGTKISRTGHLTIKGIEDFYCPLATGGMEESWAHVITSDYGEDFIHTLKVWPVISTHFIHISHP